MRHLCFLVDCSQSMTSIVEKVYEGLLTILMKTQAKDEDILVSYGGFNRTFQYCFTRKKAKFLSVLPEPFSTGGTAIYESLHQSLNTFKFDPNDEVLFILATDGQDEGYNPEVEIAEAKKSLASVQQHVKSFKITFVSLSKAADVHKVSADLGYDIDTCCVGTTVDDMIGKFVNRVIAEL